jgi:hypothetical protein
MRCLPEGDTWKSTIDVFEQIFLQIVLRLNVSERRMRIILRLREYLRELAFDKLFPP